MLALSRGFWIKLSPDRRSAIPVESLCLVRTCDQNFLLSLSSEIKFWMYEFCVFRQTFCVSLLISAYFVQSFSRSEIFAFEYHLCFWRRRRFVSVLIHGLCILLEVNFEGTWTSMRNARFFIIQFQSWSTGSEILWEAENRVAKALASFLIDPRSTFFQSLMSR